MHPTGFFSFSKSTNSHVSFFSNVSIFALMASLHSSLDNVLDNELGIGIVFKVVRKLLWLEENFSSDT